MTKRTRKNRHQSPEENAAHEQHRFFGQLGATQQFRQLFEYLPDTYFFAKDSNSRLMAAEKHQRGQASLMRIAVSE